jgi:putative toxin-antitoxin system antitoxin component (TIGR02293 family)
MKKPLPLPDYENIQNLSVLREAAAAYISNDTYFIIDKAREGVTKGAFMKFVESLDYSFKEIASILNLSERTLHRYKDSTKMSKDASERALHLASLYNKGADVFGSKDAFNAWLKQPNPIFWDKRPIDFLDTIFGFQLIEDELIKMEYGIFA